NFCQFGQPQLESAWGGVQQTCPSPNDSSPRAALSSSLFPRIREGGNPMAWTLLDEDSVIPVRAADAEGHGCREALHAGDVGAPACRCSTVPATGRVLYCGYNNFSEHVPSSNIAAGKRELAVQEDVAKDEVLAAR
ncbi:unnamed protein product, partial [Effrenium voratum]